jgi:hypothetical protein
MILPLNSLETEGAKPVLLRRAELDKRRPKRVETHRTSWD